jgi:hypothetical protein
MSENFTLQWVENVIIRNFIMRQFQISILCLSKEVTVFTTFVQQSLRCRNYV